MAAASVVLGVSSCGGSQDTAPGTGNGDDNGGPGNGGAFRAGGGDDSATACTTGLCTQRVSCPNGKDTTVSGIIYDPAGRVPLYNVVVYVPNAPVSAIQSGASCDRCDEQLYSGHPLSGTQTDASGHFKIPNMPVGKDIPLVIQLGKWRRQITIPSVTACADTPLTDKDQTRLPRKQSEGNIPLIAITTGGADSMECLPLRMGIDISEFSAKGGPGRIHLYKGDDLVDSNDSNNNLYATGQFSPEVAGGAGFANSTEAWSSTDQLKAYDMVILSCEGTQNVASKPPTSLQALYDYETMGGRVFASHWHEYFFSHGPSIVQSTGTWNEAAEQGGSEKIGYVKVANGSTPFPKGVAMADWLQNVGATTTRTQLSIKQARGVLQTVNAAEAQEWVSIPNYPTNQDPPAVQFMSYNAPIGASNDLICGRAVFTDMHVSSGATQDVAGTQGALFPQRCAGYGKPGGVSGPALSAQEKALEFMLFDLSSCISNDNAPPPPITIIH